MTRNRASAKKAGSQQERLMADWFAERLQDDRIDRRVKRGQLDRGDIGGLTTLNGTRIVAEVKNTSRDSLPAWIKEAEIERANDDAGIAVIFHKKRGSAQAADQYVTMTAEMFARLLEGGTHESQVVVADPMTVRGL